MWFILFENGSLFQLFSREKNKRWQKESICMYVCVRVCMYVVHERACTCSYLCVWKKTNPLVHHCERCNSTKAAFFVRVRALSIGISERLVRIDGELDCKRRSIVVKSVNETEKRYKKKESQVKYHYDEWTFCHILTGPARRKNTAKWERAGRKLRNIILCNIVDICVIIHLPQIPFVGWFIRVNEYTCNYLLSCMIFCGLTCGLLVTLNTIVKC